MTQEEIKNLDKKIVAIQDPFGKGFVSFQKIFKELSLQRGTSKISILQEYMDWKTSHHS